MAEPVLQPVTSLYVHVPFCAQKCAYCAFYSEASSGDLINRYVTALCREMEMVAGDLRPATIFFGGGTPSLLNLAQWERIGKTMETLKLTGASEWTVECNPATVSLDKARLLKSFGVNRISMGVQSLDEDLLTRLGRVHDRSMVFRSFDLLRQAGITNINIDLMFAIPGQSLKVWKETLSEAIALGSEHLSSYEVIYEEDTALYAQLKAGEFDLDEDLACEMYEELIAQAERGGLSQYEIANFARTKTSAQNLKLADSVPDRASTRHFVGDEVTNCFNSSGDIPRHACRHNINYWQGGSFYGLGPSASGYVRGVRTKNWSNTQMYCEQLLAGKFAIESREELPAEARAGELAAFGLRMVSGWQFQNFQIATGQDLRQGWALEMDKLISRGWASRNEDGFRLTGKGLRFADAAAELFLR